MKNRSLHEAVLLLLPICLIGSVAYFQQRRVSMEREKWAGPYRTVVSRVEPLSVNGFEAAAGFDTKFTIWVTDLGTPPTRRGTIAVPAELQHRFLYQDLKLAGRVGKHTEYVRPEIEMMRYETSLVSGKAMAFYEPFGDNRANTPEMPLTILVNSRAFPPQSEVRVEGGLKMCLPTRTSTSKSAEIPAHTLPFSYLVRRAHQKIALPVLKVPTTKLESSTVIYLSPSYQHTSKFMYGKNAIVRVVVNGPEEVIHRGNTLWLDTRLTARDGKVLASRGSFDTLSSYKFARSKNRQIYEWRINAADLSGRVGPISASGAVSLDGTTPATFSAVVRPAWVMQQPLHLKLESVGLKSGKVIAVVRYSASTPLSFTDSKSNIARIYGHEGEFFDNRDDYRYNSELLKETSSWYEWMEQNQETTHLPPPRPRFFQPSQQDFWWDDTKNSYLITNWSQHLTIRGKEYWHPKSVAVKAVTALGNGRYQVEYGTNALTVLKAGEKCRFNAQIGLKGEGFLPVEAVISKAPV